MSIVSYFENQEKFIASAFEFELIKIIRKRLVYQK